MSKVRGLAWGLSPRMMPDGMHYPPSWDGRFSVWRKRPQHPLAQTALGKYWQIFSSSPFSRCHVYPNILISIFQAQCSVVTPWRFQCLLYTARVLPGLVANCLWEGFLYLAVSSHSWCVNSCYPQMGLLSDLCLIPPVFYETDFLVRDINTFLPSNKISIHSLRNPSSSDY